MSARAPATASGRPEVAMVLSAGFGTRMRPLTDSCPKPLLEVAGRTLLDRTLDLVEGAGIGRVVVNLHYLGDMIGAHLERRETPEVQFSPEEPELLDTGGGIRQALPLLGPGAFVTINSDAVFAGPNPIARLMAGWAGAGAGLDALLLLVPRDSTIGYTRPGDFFLAGEGGAIARRGKAETAPYVFTGAQVIRAEAFAGTPEGPFSLNIVWDRLIAAGRVGGISYAGGWVDVGTPPGLDLAARALAEAERADTDGAGEA